MTDSETSGQRVHAIIVAAGAGSRSGLGIPKQFQPIHGKPMIRHSVERFLDHPAITKVWIAIGKDQEQSAEEALRNINGYELISGGDSRQESVRNGLEAIQQSGGADKVLIHDAARPFIPDYVMDAIIERLNSYCGVIPVLPVVDTLISSRNDLARQTLDRSIIHRVQTPQGFDFSKILAAHSQWDPGMTATDDSQIFQAAGHAVSLVEGSEKLKKYTVASDFDEGKHQMMTRTGLGFDVHRLSKGEELWLGGIKIDHDFGLEGHSDADVLLHALTDALLGAVGEGDIGDHFPPNDPKWKGASSAQFVEFAVSLIEQKGGRINNVDMTIICEAPKIKPHRQSIRQNIAQLLDIGTGQVGVKATTTESLGFTGRGEGIAAQAVATISLEDQQ